MRTYLVLVLLAIPLILNSGQTTKESSVQIKIEKITFSVRITDRIYNADDTLIINYSVLNQTDSIVYIFDPHQLYWETSQNVQYDSLHCEYLYELGANFEYKIGYESNVILISIKPHSSYDFQFKLMVSNKAKLEHYLSNTGSWINPQNISFRLISFYIGYIKDTKYLNLAKKNANGYTEFINDEAGLFFEVHLKRVILGPIRIFVKN